jgi:hypothetical protein
MTSTGPTGRRWGCCATSSVRVPLSACW